MRRLFALVVAVVAVVASVAAAGCAAPAREGKEPRWPPLPEGCDIKIFSEIPPMQTENIGPVQATCDDSVTDADCLRTLKDQACKLGADLIWGIDDVPSKVPGKKHLSGRAAHTRTAGNR